MKSLLNKCTYHDFEFLSETLDSYLAFTNDSKRKELLKAYKNNPSDTTKSQLVDLIDKQIRYYGSSDIAYIWRELFSSDGGVSADELINDVAEKIKVNIKLGASIERKLELLVNATFDKEIHSKSPEELREYLKKAGIEKSKIEQIEQFIKDNGKVAILPALYRILGSKIALPIVENVIVALLAKYIGTTAAKKLLEEILKRNPWLNALGPIIWVVSSSWLAFDLQGEAYRKTVPICLYLGLVALRDGEEPE